MNVRGEVILICLAALCSCQDSTSNRVGPAEQTEWVQALIMFGDPYQPVDYVWIGNRFYTIVEPANASVEAKLERIHNGLKADPVCSDNLYEAKIRIGVKTKGETTNPPSLSKWHRLYDISNYRLSTRNRPELRKILEQKDIGGQTVCSASPDEPDYARPVGGNYVTASRLTHQFRGHNTN